MIQAIQDVNGRPHDPTQDLIDGTFLGGGPDELLMTGWQDGSLFKKEELQVQHSANDIVYNAEPTASKFHHDEVSRVKALRSGVGMGKTTALVMDLMLKAQNQAPDKNGVRWSKWAVIRSTYAQLKTTTLRTFLEWLPRDHVKVTYGSPINVLLQMGLPDGTRVHAEFLFFPLDRPAQYANLLSLEITGAAINEVSEIRLASVLKYLLSRTNRYPPKRVAPITWSGVIMDFNPPAIGTWLHQLFETEKKPRGYECYTYPPAVLIVKNAQDPDNQKLWEFEMNPDAENTSHTSPDYWLNMCEDYRYDWALMQRFVLGEYTYGGVGRPVHAAFSELRHIRRGLKPWRNQEIVLGFDFGLYTAVTIGQQQDKHLTILEAFSVPDSGLVSFLEDHLMPVLNMRYQGIPRVATGDPSGNNPDPMYRMTCIKLLKQRGFRFKQAPKSNGIRARLEAVNHYLRLADAFQIDPKYAGELVNALGGAYHWAESPTSEIIKEVPEKDDASHISDSCQYLCQYFYKGPAANNHTHGSSTESVVHMAGARQKLRRAGRNSRFA